MTYPLVVSKASAGSGKTFKLATEYIKLLIRDPQAYRQILAVTFTNKATEEMKMRILSQLYGIWRGLDDSRRYAERVQTDLQASPQWVAERAGVALHNLLHNYSYFRVETIDAFFQSVLRNLARELDLTANLRIGLNDYQVEEMAVDRLIDNLSSTDQMLQWILKYIMDSIGEDRSWNVLTQIKEFGHTIFRDYYKQQSRQLNELLAKEGFIERYTESLRAVRAKAKARMAGLADDFFSALSNEGLTVDDLSYGKSGVAGLFFKLKAGEFDESCIGKRATDSLGQPEKWCKKTHPRRELIYHLADTTLGSLLRQAIDEQPRQWRLYKSADLTLRHLSQLRLLGSIEKKVRELNEDANRFLLSDTQQLLHDLIEGSDSPFIFEKIGTQLEHIMIDEFQDTSTVQWQNFKVLLEEAMSHENSSNLIVGDVKQSIYRWRSGDWRLLAHIDQQFADSSERLRYEPLDTNYRSDRRIVYFNNAFFTAAASIEEVTAYGDVAQKVVPSKPDSGQVSVVLLPSADYQSATLQRLVADVQQLLERGVAASSIAILVRANSSIPLIANYFMEQMPQVKVVSDEAFRLDASPAVMTIIIALRYLLHPDDTIARAYLAKMASGRLDGPLPEAFTNRLLSLPLYELAERLYGIFNLGQMAGQSAYLCAFYDHIANYVNEQTADVTTFLQEWDEVISSKTIQSPDVSGIRLISIHKSKGLEFDHVFIPFCDWRLEMNDILWCRPDEEPFSQLPLAPIDFSRKGMQGTIYEKYYDEEHQQNLVDNLNLLYVAFTRAGRSLHVYGRRNAKSSRSLLIEQTLPLLVDQLEGADLTGADDAEAPMTFSYGELPLEPSREEDKGPQTANPFLQASTSVPVGIEVFGQKVTFRQSNHSRDFSAPADDDDEARQNSYIQLGSVLHNVFASIRTADDVERALRQLEVEGIIYDHDITRERIQTMIRKRLSSPHVADWFSGRWQLFNECTILSVDPATRRVIERRPDRVMTDGQHTVVVDFKFGREHPEYHDQVKAYMQLLQSMGYPDVRGYLWFVYSNEIIEVK